MYSMIDTSMFVLLSLDVMKLYVMACYAPYSIYFNNSL